MATYTSNLKTWGSIGEEFPDGYNYEQGKQPVAEWDNFFNSHAEKDLDHLITLTNKRLESSSGTTYPTTPEPGHVTWRSDTQRLAVYDDTAGVWEGLMKVAGDTMQGALDMGGFGISNVGGIESNGNVLIGENEVIADKTITGFYSKSRHIGIGTAVQMYSEFTADAPVFEGKRARGDSEATKAAVQENDRLVRVRGLGYVGSDTWATVGDFTVRADGPPQGVNGDIVPGSAHIRTMNAAGDVHSRLIVDSEGTLDLPYGGAFIQGGGPNGSGEVKFGQGSRIYENGSGELVAEDSLGNATQLT